MTVKDVLIHMADDGHHSQRLEAGIAVAQKFEAHLIALYVAFRHSLPGFIRPYFTDEMLAGHRAQAEKSMASVQTEFEAHIERAGISGEWRVGEANNFGAVVGQARYSDLVVASQRDPDSTEADAECDLVEELVLHSARPVLAISHSGKFKSFGDNIIVAWNGTREASRAVHEALPFLTSASRVIVLGINLPDQDHIPCSDIAVHLARHGAPVEVHNRRTDRVDIGNTILNAVSDFSADMLVMGGYGHSRFREIVLGGATRHLLQHMTVPVLMAH